MATRKTTWNHVSPCTEVIETYEDFVQEVSQIYFAKCEK